MSAFKMNEQLKGLVTIVLGLAFALFLGLKLGASDYQPLVLTAGILLIFIIWFGTGETFWVITVASSFLGGTFPILGGSFNPFQILMAIGVAKFLVEEIIFKHRSVARVNRLDFILLLCFMAVLTFHAVKDRFGMRFLGSQIWGGRNYINVYVGLAAFFIIQTVPVKSRVWGKLPYLVLAVTGFDLLIAIITTLAPSSIYKIYPFYSAVSTSGISELLTGEAVETARVGGFGNFGYVLIILVMASVSLRRLLSPANLPRIILLLVGWAGVLFSSFRSSVFNSLIAMLLAGIRDLRWAVVVLLPILVAGLISLSIINSQIVHLPKQVQRSLSFLPGNWDTEMQLDAASSNDFRKRVWTIWINEYFPIHPWFGRGFGFRSEAATTSVYEDDPYADKIMVEVGNVHNGFFATVDAFGIMGTIFFALWNLRLLFRAVAVSSGDNSRGARALRFVALYLGVSIVSYWFGALSVGSFLPQEFALAGAFLAMRKGRVSQSTEPAELQPASGRFSELRPV